VVVHFLRITYEESHHMLLTGESMFALLITYDACDQACTPISNRR